MKEVCNQQEASTMRCIVGALFDELARFWALRQMWRVIPLAFNIKLAVVVGVGSV